MNNPTLIRKSLLPTNEKSKHSFTLSAMRRTFETFPLKINNSSERKDTASPEGVHGKRHERERGGKKRRTARRIAKCTNTVRPTDGKPATVSLRCVSLRFVFTEIDVYV
jgi:hypothetical protein